MSERITSNIFLIFFIILILAVMGHNFKRYYVDENYEVYTFVDCNPSVYSCFEANESITAPAYQIKPYAKVKILSTNSPACLEEHTCQNFSCNNINGFCVITYCTDETKEGEENCTELNI